METVERFTVTKPKVSVTLVTEKLNKLSLSV